MGLWCRKTPEGQTGQGDGIGQGTGTDQSGGQARLAQVKVVAWVKVLVQSKWWQVRAMV